MTLSCSSCGQPVAAGSRFCARCGEPVAPSSESPTRLGPPRPRRDADPSLTSSPGLAGGRFLPGAVLAGRYRIVALLGKGGMGEVYRADDLKLGQPVALKFLPEALERDAGRLGRLLNEVRTARQVSHPNVCRVYDVGEADARHFLSMEYVDGEDLASLLRRIGRLPKDKAIQLARQIAAGLAAAHEAGVLHRDLKPSNVMIDGRGRARITDFGLAGLAGAPGDRGTGFGTPAYMAPEQLAGREATARSDLYALGLVLYELFTGKPPFAARTIDDLRRLQTETTPASPASLVEGFDPAVERVILRCLERDPARRPQSALAVAAALPGGDPLAAALAAGETPSPELVAEAGDPEALRPALAWGALGLFLVAVAGFVLLAPRTAFVAMVPLEKPPEFLAERAREILRDLGYKDTPADSLAAFAPNPAYLTHLEKQEGPSRGGWDVLREAPPSGLLFWYRQSPAPLVKTMPAAIGDWMDDPPDDAPGMARVGLDLDGRLVSLRIVPGERTGPGSPPEPDWAPLLRAAGLDPAALTTAEPEWAPPVFADRRAAWEGVYPGAPEVAIRVEAAAAGGRPVSLRIVEPWTRPAEAPAPPRSFWQRAGSLVSTLWFVVVVVAAGIVALRNVRRGRGDRRGALRFALYLGAVRMLWFLGAHHVPSAAELGIFVGHLSYAMQRVGLAYVFYLAVEPYARRLWPRMLVSWVRVLDGRLRDPLVGRDLLLGCLAGAVVSLAQRLSMWLSASLGVETPPPDWRLSLEPLRGPGHALVQILIVHTQQLLDIIFPITMLLLMRLLLRRTWLAVAAVSLGAVVMFHPGAGSTAVYLLVTAVVIAVIWLTLFRAGLLALAAATSISGLLDLPLTPSPAGWYAGAVLLALAAVVVPAVYGFWRSQAGRPLFRDEILEPAVQR
jgi:serine/threonine-protein kinase